MVQEEAVLEGAGAVDEQGTILWYDSQLGDPLAEVT